MEKNILKRDFKADAPNQKWVTDFLGTTMNWFSEPFSKVGISMSRRSNCYDNASMGSFFSHLKTEGLCPCDIRNMNEAKNPPILCAHSVDNGTLALLV